MASSSKSNFVAGMNRVAGEDSSASASLDDFPPLGQKSSKSPSPMAKTSSLPRVPNLGCSTANSSRVPDLDGFTAKAASPPRAPNLGGFWYCSCIKGF